MNEKNKFLLNEDIDKYYAHIIENDKGNVIKKEYLKEHIDRTCKYFNEISDEKRMEQILKRILINVSGTFSKDVYEFFLGMIEGIPLYHDYGKINPVFQKNIMKNERFQDSILQNMEIGSKHSFLSALAYIEHFRTELRMCSFSKENKILLRFFMILNSYIISRHHSYLCDFEYYKNEQLTKNVDDILEFLKEISGLEKLNLNSEKLKTLVENNYDNVVDKMTRQQSIDIYVYIKLVYSLLVASDYYATSEFMNDIQMTSFGNISDLDQWQKIYEDTELMKNIRSYQKNIYPNREIDFSNITNINLLRTEILIEAEKNLKKNKDKNIFYLEAPTGSGKSNTALDLTFQLSSSDMGLNKVFYIYPFNTLVEQNINSIRKIFGNSKDIFDRIAVINSLTPIRVEEQKENHEDKAYLYQKALLNRQFLNYPMILSTHVSLFNTIFGITKDSVFGFHQLCNSIIILDEIQSYKNSIWGEIICFLKEMSSIMNIKIIIMSATLPNLDLLAKKMEPAVSLIPDSDKYFKHKCFRNRVKISYELMDVENIEDFLIKHIKNQALTGKKVLVEFITKTTAERFFRNLKEDGDINKYVEYMSGDDSIIERKRILDFVETTTGPVILVATQVVEAGIDIDMDVGYKNISKLDSDEQFLGRINRSCKKEDCTVYFFKIDESDTIFHDIRTKNKNLTLENDDMKQILVNKDFDIYYKKVLSILNINLCENKSIGLEYFFGNTKHLEFSKINEEMQLIEDDEWSMTVFLARDIKDLEGNVISGTDVWKEYIELINSLSMDYSEKMVKMSIVKSKMAYFIYQIKKTDNFAYNDRIGEIYYIEDGNSYFLDGKLDTDKIEKGCSFI